MAYKNQGNERYYPQNNYNLDWFTAAKAFNNPWTALGALIGTSLAKNYVNRGEEKLEKSLENSIPTGEAPTDAQVTQQMIQNAQAQAPTREEQVQDNIFNKYKQANPIEINPQQMSNIGLEALKNQTADPIETAALQGAIDKANGNVQASQVTPNENIAFQEYLKNNAPHMDASGNLSNMDAAANLQAQKQQATAQVAENNMRPFSVEDWEAQVWAEGRKQGRPDYQIQAVIDRMKPQAEAAERKYNDKMKERYLNQYYNNLPNADGTGGDPAMRLDAQIGLYKYDPDAARILGAGGTPTIRDTINMNIRKDEQARDNAYKYAKLAVDQQKGNTLSGNNNIPAAYKQRLQEIDFAETQGLINAEEATRRRQEIGQEIAQNAGKNSAQIKADNNLNPFKQELTQKINTLRDGILNSYKTGDVEATGNTLNEIKQILEQNPDAWKSLSQSERDQIESQSYFANGMRQLAIGDITGAKKFFAAIPSYIAEQNQWDFSDDALDELANHFKKVRGDEKSYWDSLEEVVVGGIPYAAQKSIERQLAKRGISYEH